MVLCSMMVTDLAFGQEQDQRFFIPIADRVRLGIEAALGASGTAGTAPFTNE